MEEPHDGSCLTCNGVAQHGLYEDGASLLNDLPDHAHSIAGDHGGEALIDHGRHQLLNSIGWLVLCCSDLSEELCNLLINLGLMGQRCLIHNLQAEREVLLSDVRVPARLVLQDADDVMDVNPREEGALSTALLC